jgi:hypothetical protein
MKSFNLSRLAAVPVAMAMVLFPMALAGQQTPQSAVPVEFRQQQPAAHREIVVSLEDRKLALIENGEIKKIYTVSVGTPSTPSPEGTFTIQRRVANPTYHHDGRTVLPGPTNPVGTRWMGLNKAGYGIHGTNEPKSIGKAASHGCVRMGRADLEEFFALVAVGDTVRMVGHRDEETARLFGPADTTALGIAKPAQTAEAVPTAPAASEPGSAAAASPGAAVTTVATMARR